MQARILYPATLLSVHIKEICYHHPRFPKVNFPCLLFRKLRLNVSSKPDNESERLGIQEAGNLQGQAQKKCLDPCVVGEHSEAWQWALHSL